MKNYWNSLVFLEKKDYTKKELMAVFKISYHVLRELLDKDMFYDLFVTKRYRYGRVKFLIEVVPYCNMDAFKKALIYHNKFINSLK